MSVRPIPTSVPSPPHHPRFPLTHTIANSRSPSDLLKPNLTLTPHRDPQIASEAARQLLEQGYDPESFWEQEIVWGDHDSFQ